MNFYALKTNFDFLDITTESIWLALTIIIFLAVWQLYLASSEKVWLIPSVGGFLYVLGSLIDLLDEFLTLPNIIDNLFENYFKLIGYTLFSFGFVLLTRRLAKQAVIDPLTDIHNRRSLFEAGHREIERAKRNQSKFSLIFIDVDKFKQINDRLGHMAGDSVLHDIAVRMRETVRSVDLLARFGGDEFVILMPDTAIDEGMLGLRRIKESVSGVVLPDHKRVRISLGIAQYPDDGDSMEQLLAVAGKNMYKDKDQGKHARTA